MAWAVATGAWRLAEGQAEISITLFSLAGVMGVGNMGSYTVLRALLADQFVHPHVQTTALATQGLFNSFVQTLGFVVGPSLSIEAKAHGLLVLWLCAGVSSLLAWKVSCCQDKQEYRSTT